MAQSTETAAPVRYPTNETGIYLRHHPHVWVEVGAKLYPVGTWHPVFECSTCGDVICDLFVEVDEPVTPPVVPEGGA